MQQLNFVEESNWLGLTLDEGEPHYKYNLLACDVLFWSKRCHSAGFLLCFEEHTSLEEKRKEKEERGGRKGK